MTNEELLKALTAIAQQVIQLKSDGTYQNSCLHTAIGQNLTGLIQAIQGQQGQQVNGTSQIITEDTDPSLTIDPETTKAAQKKLTEARINGN